MKELTEATPKALLEVAGKPILQYAFDALPDSVDEVIVVVGYMGAAIQQRFGGEYKGKRIMYVEQGVLDGTAGALWRAKDILKDRFVVMMADDIYSREDIESCIATENWVMLVEKLEHMQSGGCVRLDAHGNIKSIDEGDHKGNEGIINTNLFVLDTRLFDFPLIPKAVGSEEFGLPQTILPAAKESGVPFTTVKATSWIQIVVPEDLQKAEEILAARG